MRLTEAIATTQTIKRVHKVYLLPSELEALNLLIEAGKRCLLARKETSFVGPGLLPGETEE